MYELMVMSSRRAGSWLGREAATAWAALGLVPLAALAAIEVQGRIAALLGRPGRSMTDLPVDVAAWSLTGAVLVFLIPCAVALVYGRRAVAAGDPTGWAPVVLAVIAVVGYLELNLVAIALVRTL